MPENPVYDPNKIVSRGYDKGESSVQGDIITSAPKYDPNKIVSRGYVPKDTIVKEGFTAGEVDGGSSDDELEKKLDFIQNKIPGERNLRDDERDILRDMMKNSNANQKDISDAILTFKGVHPEQVYNRKGPIRTTPEYYLDRDEKGVYKPVPLGENKSLPAEKQMASIWGTGKEAQDDAWYTDLAKKAFNIIPTVMEDVTDFVTAAAPTLRKIGNKIEGTEYEGSTVAESGKEAKKFFQQFKMPLSEEYSQSIYNSEDIKGFEDLISKDRVKLNLTNVYGTVSNLAASVGEMLLTGKVAGEGILSTKAAVKGVAPTLSKAEKYASVYTASYLTNLGEAMDAAKKAGISEEDAGAWAMAVTVPIAALDAGLGVGGKILSNKLANEGKKDLLQNIANNIVKDELGNVTEESLKKAATEAVKAYAPVAKGFISTVKLGSKDVLEQGTEEALQSFMSSAGEQLYDKLSDADKAKFGTDAFSAQSIGKYISEGVAGLVGSGPLAYSTAKAKQKELYNAQSNSAYEAVKEGEEGVKAFKTNITNAFEKGEINQQDYDNAMLKMDAYDSYNKVSSDLTLDDANKKKLFELSLQKENLKASIKAAEAKDTEGHSRLDKMTPPELGLHNAKVKQAKALQDDIDLIVAKSEIIQQPEVSESVVDKVIKEEEKAAAGPKERVKGEPKSEIGELLGRYGQIKVKESKLEEMVPNGQKYTPPKKVTDETRAMKDISPDEWNASDFDVTIKQHKFADALDATPEKTTFGTLQQDNLFEKKVNGKKQIVQTFNMTLPNGKTVRTASSKVRYPEEGSLGGFMGNFYEENLTDRNNVIGQKVGATVRTLKDSGRKVVFLWNAEEGPKYGKHLAMVKERLRGKSDYSVDDINEMDDLRMMNMGENPNAPAPGIINPEGPINEGPAKKPSKEAPKSKPSKEGLKDVEISDKKKIAEYRKKEQEDLKEANINLEDYPDTYGEEQGNMPDDLYATYKPIYDKYNKLINDISENKPAESSENKPVLEYRSTKNDTNIGSKNYKENKNQFTGRSSSKVLPSGEKIKGKYKLVEAKDVLASHNEKNFGQTENFPKREDGSTLNDRDYGRDKNAQKEVVRIANNFDSRALDNIPTVTNDGIVVDGNNRTMSRKLAAENNTDTDYKEALKEQADMYGFTEEQVNSLKNPFLVFEMEGNVEYSTKLFSEFNKSEKKEKSPIDKAIEVSKTIDERSKRLISDLYSDVSTPSEVTSNPVKVRQAIKILQDLGILQPNELPRYFDITKNTTTKDGVSLLESIVLGSTLTESALRSLDVEGMGKVRTQLLSSIAQLTKNSTLGKDSLTNEISTVVNLINTLKSLDLSLDQYVNQPDLFGDKQKVNINEYAVATALSESGFKKWLQDYNNRVGQMDMFKGDVVTKNEILEETIQKNTGKPASSIFGVEKLQKVKPKAETVSKFKQSVDLFYKAKDTDGASKRRAILEQRREFLEKNPSFKYIDDNMKYIYKELEQKGIIERFGECP